MSCTERLAGSSDEAGLAQNNRTSEAQIQRHWWQNEGDEVLEENAENEEISRKYINTFLSCLLEGPPCVKVALQCRFREEVLATSGVRQLRFLKIAPHCRSTF